MCGFILYVRTYCVFEETGIDVFYKKSFAKKRGDYGNKQVS